MSTPDETLAMPVAARDACRSCGSGDRTEAHYVASPLTGIPVTCTDDWHDEDAAEPGTQRAAAEDDHEPTLVSVPAFTPGGWDLTSQLPAPCRCGMCPESQEPPSGLAMLSYAPGVTARMHDARVRNGQWDDIPAAWDDAYINVHRPCHDARRAIGRDVADGRHAIADVLNADPDAHYNARIAEGLRQLEREMPARLAATRLWVAQRAAEVCHGERTEAAA